MAVLRKSEWLETGLQLLAKGGPEAIRIDQLCKAAAKTRGSFYHHFKNRQAFVRQLIAYWRQSRTRAVIEKTNAGSSNAERRLHDLARNVLQVEGAFEAAIRRWATVDAEVAAVLAAVDGERIAYIADLLIEVHPIDADTAHNLALLQYAVFVGIGNMQQINGKEQKLALARMLSRMSKASFDR